MMPTYIHILPSYSKFIKKTYLHVCCMLLGNFLASGVNSRWRGITQKKAYNIQNMAIAWNQEISLCCRATWCLLQGEKGMRRNREYEGMILFLKPMKFWQTKFKLFMKMYCWFLMRKNQHSFLYMHLLVISHNTYSVPRRLRWSSG